MAVSGFDIDAPRWDQSTFMGRLKHFVNITDWRTALLPDSRLDEHWWRAAASLPPGTTEEQLHYAKKLYDSAFHPDTGNRMNLIGRMSFQVPGEMAITGGMLQFYRTVPALVFWHQIGVAYLTATSTALATAVALNLYTKKAPPLMAPWVPFAAVASANCVNIPMMRQQELLNGIAVTDENGNKLGHSKGAAAEVSVLESLACPNLVFMVTAACSQFSQQCSIGVSKLEPEVREAILSRYGGSVQNVYFYKGL